MRSLIEEIGKGIYISGVDDDYNNKVKKNKYYKSLDSSTLQIDINELFAYLRQNNLLDYLINNVNDIKEDKLYPSKTHGINHNIRVMVFALYLAKMNNLSKEDMSLIMDAAKYHDIGRINDEEDKEHGLRSANMIDDVITNPNYDINLLKAIIELHSIDDSNFDIIKEKYNIDDSNKLKLLYKVLKDADALDRIRLSYRQDDVSSLNYNMLRFDISRSLVKSAHQLNEFYVKKHKINVILDTDVENEIDDKFALVYLLNSLDVYNLEAITIAPFSNSLYSRIMPNTKDNIEYTSECSYEEAKKIITMLNLNLQDIVYKGSTGYIKDGYNNANDAVEKIIEIANKNEKTYIVAIGALTNVALAIKKNPNIIDRIEVIWLGGNDYTYNNNDEFNYRQDIEAVRTVYESGVKLTVIPCINVASVLTTTIFELEHYLSYDNEVERYLLNEYKRVKKDQIGTSKTLWDLSAIAYLINEYWFEKNLIRHSFVNESKNESQDTTEITVVKRLSRDKIFKSFFSRIKK